MPSNSHAIDARAGASDGADLEADAIAAFRAWEADQLDAADRERRRLRADLAERIRLIFGEAYRVNPAAIVDFRRGEGGRRVAVARVGDLLIAPGSYKGSLHVGKVLDNDEVWALGRNGQAADICNLIDLGGFLDGLAGRDGGEMGGAA